MDMLEERIRQRAYRIWEDEGRPDGRADAHWDMASELLAIEDNHAFALKPIRQNLAPNGEPIEPIEAVEMPESFPRSRIKAKAAFAVAI
jgi:hypothetical protein